MWNTRGVGSFVAMAKELQVSVARDVLVLSNAISAAQHDLLVREIRSWKKFQRQRYEWDHWDTVIVGYKEKSVPLEQWGEGRSVLESIQTRLAEYLRAEKNVKEEVKWLDPHVIELKRGGYILPHVDSKFSGGMVAGLSLLSTRRMVLTVPRGEYEDLENPMIHQSSGGAVIADMYLPPGTLYALTGVARYNLSHEIPSEESISWGDQPPVPGNEQRISIIFRDAPLT